MVTARLNGVPYQLCSCWEDVEVDRLLACDGESKNELAALSNIPPDLIARYDDLQLFPLYVIISFVHEAELLPYFESRNVIKEQYRTFENAKMALREGKPYKKLLAVAKVFYPEEKKTVRLVGLGLSLVQQIALFLENYSDMIHAKPEKNEVEAGIEVLGAFGYWGTAYTLAGRDILKVDEILSKSVIEVYTALYYSFKESRYNKRKFELDHPPKPGKR